MVKIFNFEEYLNEHEIPGMSGISDPGYVGYSAQPAVDPAPPNVLHTLLIIQASLKLAHWQTRSFADHKALDDIYKEISDKADLLAEAYIGKCGERILPPGLSINLTNVNQTTDMQLFVDTLVCLFDTCMATCLTESDTELINIADEIRAQFMKLKYLFTLRENNTERE